jgi:hypothetical protein
MGQSDNRKVALWILNGAETDGNGTARTTANTGTGTDNALSQLYTTVTDILDRQGVPYSVFLPTDSANWGPDWEGAGAAVADSTWFRSQGYMGHVICQPDMVGTNDNSEMKDYFNDGDGNVGVQQGSPLDGDWGTPVILLAPGFFTGETSISVDVGDTQSYRAVVTGQNIGLGQLANGDSLEWSSQINQYDPSDAADVTVLAYGDDSLNTGTAMKAWQYKTSLFIYRFNSGGGTNGAFLQPQGVVLALGKLFDEAGYVPSRPLNLQMLIDHPFEDSQAAHIESLVAQMKRGKWELNLGPLTPMGQQAGVWTGGPVFSANKDLFWANPHSHYSEDAAGDPVLWGNYMNFASWDKAGEGWDVKAWTDTSNIYPNWRVMNASITDSLGLRLVAGYNRHANLPGGGMSDLQAYGLAQMGYFSVRAFTSDSTGAVNRRLTHNPLTYSGARNLYWSRPWIMTDHQSTDGPPIWVIPEMEFGCSSCSTWTQAWTLKAAYNPINTRPGVLNRELAVMGRAMIGGMGWFFHGHNLRGDDELMATTLRRLASLQRAAPNMFAVTARAEPLIPRRHNTARPSGGIPRP